jgi:hypothetical protein
MAVIISVESSLLLNVTATLLGDNLASYRILPSVVMKCDSFPLEPETRRQVFICPQFFSTKITVRPAILKFSAKMEAYHQCCHSTLLRMRETCSSGNASELYSESSHFESRPRHPTSLTEDFSNGRQCF